jgi:serine/threonine protein kinase
MAACVTQRHQTGQWYILPGAGGPILILATVLISSLEGNNIVVKLGDFGLGTFMDPERAPTSYAGTSLYKPPVSQGPKRPYFSLRLLKQNIQEISRSSERGIRWTKYCDIYSLGCMFLPMTSPHSDISIFIY